VGWLSLLAGFVVGFGVAGVVSVRRSRRRGTVASFRAAPGPQTTASPYRGDPSAPAEPALRELVAAVREAGLGARTRTRGFDLWAGKHVLRLRVTDPGRVALASIELADTGHETLIFELALAFVPLYGPIVVTEALWGSFVVDRTRDAAALRDDRGERIKALARAIQARLAASQPLWQKLAEKR
jgi:hypothetical protein